MTTPKMNTGRRAKRKLEGTSPPKRKPKGGKNSEADCLICEEPILEAGEHCDGDDAVYCENSCQGWIYRRFAGLTRPAIEKLGEPNTQYLCMYCMMASRNNEISKLTNIIKDLQTAIVSLTETVASLQSSVKAHTPASSQEANIATDTQAKLNVDDRSLNVGVWYHRISSQYP